MRKSFRFLIAASLTAGLLSSCGVTPVYTINFKNYDGSILETMSVQKDKTPVYSKETPTKPDYEGKKYTFSTWDPAIAAATKNQDYTAVFSEDWIDYTVSFDLKGGEGSIPDQTKHWGDKVTKPSTDPTKASSGGLKYTFKHWYTTDATVAFDFQNTLVKGNLVLNACYDSEAIKYTVSFNTNGGNTINPVQVEHGQKLETVPTPTKSATAEKTFTFDKWYTDSGLTQEFDADAPITKDTNLYAKWNEEFIDYTVSFDLKGGKGDAPASQTLHYGDKVTKPNPDPTRDSITGYNYTFKHWYRNDETVAFDFNNDTVDGSFTLNAAWETHETKFTVTFVTNGGETINPVQVQEGQKLDPVPTPTKAATAEYTYTFDHWCTDEALANEFNANDPITKNTTLYAKWNNTKNQYTVSFVYEDKSPVETAKKWDYGTTPSCTATPTKAGDDYSDTYTFANWDPAIVKVTQDATYTAKFTATGIKYNHYSAKDAGCFTYGCAEFWEDGKGNYSLTEPSVHGTITDKDEAATIARIAEIVAADPSDSRLVAPQGHNLVNDVCTRCKEFAYTNSVFDLYTGHGTKGNAKLTEDSTYPSDGYGKMYKYAHTYNDGGAFPITNMFKDVSLDGISKVSFKIVVPESRLLIAGDGTTNYELLTSGSPISTIMTFVRETGTDNWKMSDSAKKLSVYAGAKITEPASLPNRTTFDELFHSFSNWGTSYVYVSDIMTDKHVCEFVNNVCTCGKTIITASAIGNISSLTVDTTYSVPTTMGNLRMYKRSGYGSDLFASLSLEGLDEIRFYVANEDKNNGFILHSINGYIDYEGCIYGGTAPQEVIATRVAGTNNWTVTTASGINLAAGGTGVAGTSYTVNDASTLNNVLSVKSGSQSVYVSDIIAKPKAGTEVLKIVTSDAIVTGETGQKTYTLTESATEVAGYPKVYSYSCSGYFRAMFKDLDISSYKTIEFFYDCSGANDQITFKNGDSYFGFHKSAGNKGFVKAINLGDGSWKITTSGGLNMLLPTTPSSTTTTELTLTGCTKLNELFNVTGNGWCNTPITISDILVTK